MMIKVLCMLFAVVSVATAGSLIDKWGRCKISDPMLDACLSKAVGNMFKDLKNGNAEHNIPSFDPFHISDMHLKSGGNSPVNLQMDISDLTLTHLTDFSELKVDASKLKDYRLTIMLTAPAMNTTSKYVMSGKLLAMPIKGKGDANFLMKNVKFTLDLKGKPVDKDGKKYWQVTHMTLDVKAESQKSSFSNLFGGDKKLGEATNKVMNDNWKVIHKEFMPYINSEFSRTATPVANIITQLEPFDEMFPQ